MSSEAEDMDIGNMSSEKAEAPNQVSEAQKDIAHEEASGMWNRAGSGEPGGSEAMETGMQDEEVDANEEAGGPRTARLLITKMEMENFKSYGGLREIGPFHKCFSSIVGPNGSGKSNVIDAMLFVFGKRAKKLRLNKVSELIHRSDTYPNLEFARVSVHFVDILDVEGSEDGYEKVPGTELVVTRTAFSNNQSKYQVDGKNVTFAEVGALLRKRGVDLDNNRFLILQGEVEQIAMMKPKALTPHDEGLLEYLEDIIGSDRFVEDAEKAAQRVNELNDQRGEKLNRLKFAEKEKDNLESARQKAEEYLRLDAAIRKKTNVLYQLQVAMATANADKVKAKDEDLKERLAHERAKLETTVAKVKDTKRKFDAVAGEHEALRTEMSKVKAEYEEYERKDIEFQENKKFFKEQTRKLETSIRKDEKRSKDSLARATELEGGLDELQRAVKQAEARKASEEAALEKVNEGLKGEVAELRKQLEGEQEKARPVREEADTLRNKVDTVKCEIKLVKETTESAKQRLSNAEAALEKLLRKAEEDKAELGKAREESRDMEDQIRQAEEEVEEARQALDAATEAMGKAVAAAEEAKASMESTAGKSGTLRALLEASAPGRELQNAGICGRLGDLGVVSAEFDVAVSSASGTLDHVVVETAEGATACVEFLRRRNLGRASFVILEKLGHLQAALSQNFNAPKGCPRLFDLVQVSDERFRPAFYLALRDTLVASDLDTATANAYEGGRCRHRIVTKQGQLIDRSGTMTGGGNVVKRGAMRTVGGGRNGASAAAAKAAAAGTGLVTAAQVERLAAEAKRSEEAVQKARSVRREAEGRVKALLSRAKQLQTLIPKLEMRLEGVGASEAQYREQIESLKTQCQLSPEAEAELQELTVVLKRDEASLAKVSKSLDKAESAVQALQTAILEVGGDRLKKAVKRAEAASKALDEAMDGVNRSTVEAKGERKKAEKANGDAERRRKELEAIREKAEKMEKEFEGLEEKAYEVFQRYESAEKDVKEKAAEKQKVGGEYEEARALEEKIREVEEDITSKLEEYAKVIDDNRRKASHWGAELVKLRKLHEQEAREWDFMEEDGGDNDKDKSEGGKEDKEDEEGRTSRRRKGRKGEVQGGGKEGNAGGDDPGSSNEAPAEAGKEGEEGGRDDDAQMADDDDDDDDDDGGVGEGKARDEEVDGGATRGRRKGSTEKRSPPGWLPEIPSEELEGMDRDALKMEIGELEASKKKAEGEVNLNTLSLYREREKEYMDRVKEVEDITLERNEARGRHEELRRQRLEEFMAGFGKITLRLKEMYQMITLGGDAELELVDSLDPFSEGIVFSVRPPKKSWKNIANLSGGEKTLSSLALVFALHHYKPTPLYVMDEIDAALDFKNVSIVANYIKERTKNAQFIIISLRNNMFELADRLVGIYKTHNVTKSVTINPKEFTMSQGKPRATTSASKADVLVDATNAQRDASTSSETSAS